jgi:3',5'-cyclic-nucleotide phosphodiesterase
MHKAFLLATKTDLCRVMSHLDVLALLLAAVGHDAGHLGRSNAFEIASESPLALLYNNASPLENLHAATLLRIATRHGLFASCA